MTLCAVKSLWIAPEQLVLASASKIRSQILSAAGIPHEIITPAIDERELQSRSISCVAGDIAIGLARAKALDVSRKNPGRYILGADQTLSLDGVFYHKPENLSQARAQLLELRGKTHRLTSGISLMIDGHAIFETAVAAHIQMRLFSDEFLSSYLEAAGQGVISSVGSYQIEGLGVQMFEKIDGDQFTIMGLPLLPLLNYLRNARLLIS